MMKQAIILVIAALLLTSCIPDGVKKDINKSVLKMQTMLVDQNFKNAIGQIELYKLRTGGYPQKLSEVTYVPSMDSAFFRSLEYHRLDSGYELNIDMKFRNINGKEVSGDPLKYPADFWKGLGCRKSNLK